MGSKSVSVFHRPMTYSVMALTVLIYLNKLDLNYKSSISVSEPRRNLTASMSRKIYRVNYTGEIKETLIGCRPLIDDILGLFWFTEILHFIYT
jgi:hypothetical protein